MNLLSVGASYGLIVLVFQKGIGNKLFGFQQVDVIESWLPLFLFALLFGLSMDYHVFLLSRIREHFQQTGDNTESVSYGLRTTGRLITGAALIMVAVFGGFALGSMTMFQQMGFGLAVAVFLDATLVRCVLVPASMKLLGKYNWYLPKWLSWLPDLALGEQVEHVRPTEPPRRKVPAGRGIPVAIPVLAEDDTTGVRSGDRRTLNTNRYMND
jgi:RND superfamily putative drug exporter